MYTDFSKTKFVLLLDWFDESKTLTQQKENRIYFFNTAEEALTVANFINTSEIGWKSYDKPVDMYLYAYNHRDGFSEDQRFICAWFECNKTRKDKPTD